MKKRINTSIYIYVYIYIAFPETTWPLKIGLPKRDVVSQPPFFRGPLRFGEFNMIIYIYTSFAHIPLSSNTEAFFELCWNIHFSWTEVLLSFLQQSFHQKSPLTKCNPRSFTACPWKTMVGRLLSFWDGKSQGQTVKLLRSTLGRPPSPRWFDGKKRHPCLRVIFFSPLKTIS